MQRLSTTTAAPMLCFRIDKVQNRTARARMAIRRIDVHRLDLARATTRRCGGDHMNDAHEVTRDCARERIGKAIYGEDWIGDLRTAEIELLSGPYGIRKKTLLNGRPIDFIDVCPPDLRAQLDQALGRQLRAWAQLSSTVDWMDDHGLPVTQTMFPRSAVDTAVTWIARAKRTDDPPLRRAPVGGRPPTVDWETIEDALALEVKARGVPDRENPKGWRTQADVERWINNLLSDRGDQASDTTVRDHTREMLSRLAGSK
jgi:hypothetical protein